MPRFLGIAAFLLAAALIVRSVLAAGGGEPLLLPLTKQQLHSKWFSKQETFLVEFHGHLGQKLHKDLLPALEQVAKELEGRAIVRTCDLREMKEGFEMHGLKDGKLPALLLFRKGEVIRRWEPVTSWVKEGPELEEGRVKEVSAEDIVEWVDEHVEKAKKKRKKATKVSEPKDGEL
mmetsp:Transcript_55076/g.131249  ORF Transcript_55076/g.131249 Transcript_55076/m.131249 type:complete len:176 (+) Transcript_55076:78-605(+)